MDREWALREIEAFLWVSGDDGMYVRGPVDEIPERAHVVEKILERSLPGWDRDRPAADLGYQWLRDRALRGKSALARAEEIAEKLGDDAPEMDAGKLHPWVWENARSYWNTGHFEQAVAEAAKRINAETQAKTGRRDISEKALFEQAFSTNPPTVGNSRLRIVPDDGSETFNSIHRGARAYAEGLYAAIRNPTSHLPHAADGGDEHLALEQLAAFSLLARWVDEAVAVTI